eukprot:gnl/MRDRNA2_/MRDRNA2_200254_c0_seq1.p1 gnl/MRDRNA2_/MRDRNA2_200254_c0~~gnl/MRDRNA2_/MRDRNA2_200254_c0_seq1.p1  ORF type:complete len:320 (+),score=70.48 gnl/MRDRNA2_/MRDRNA2_200254_c0_seq1:3-962(+)
MPFPFVHLVTFLVGMQNLLAATSAGLEVAKRCHEGNFTGMGTEIVRLLVLCTMTQGLLVISYVVADPFGHDILDFPVVAYTEEISAECGICESDITQLVPVQTEVFTQEEMVWFAKLKEARMNRGKFDVKPRRNSVDNSGQEPGSISEKDLGLDVDSLSLGLENFVNELPDSRKPQLRAIDRTTSGTQEKFDMCPAGARKLNECSLISKAIEDDIDSVFPAINVVNKLPISKTPRSKTLRETTSDTELQYDENALAAATEHVVNELRAFRGERKLFRGFRTSSKCSVRNNEDEEEGDDDEEGEEGQNDPDGAIDGAADE